MGKRVFLDCRRDLPGLIAERLLAPFRSDELPDLGKILLALPGRLARQQVRSALAEEASRGVLLPEILTPALLLRYRIDPPKTPSATADEMIWVRTVERALRTPEKFDLVFPTGIAPGDRLLSGRRFMEFRSETVRGGRSLANLARFTGARGEQLAALEQLYLEELAACGYADPLEADRAAAADTAAFADPELKIVLAGMPDLPNLLRAKLENIERAFPGRVEVWIHAPESQRECFDEWGVPDPEVWNDMPLLLPPGSYRHALDGEDAAKTAAELAAKTGHFDPKQCAVILGDPGMFPAFRHEFAKFTAPDGTPLELYDPAGVPMGRLRLCRLGEKLTAFLRDPDDCAAAWELLREPDYLRHLTAPGRSADDLLTALDRFVTDTLPDDPVRAAELAAVAPPESGGMLAEALTELLRWPEKFRAAGVAGFIREFFRTVYADDGDADGEKLLGVSFAAECATIRELLTDLDALPERLTAPELKLRLLEVFFRNCASAAVPSEPGSVSCGAEGCLEMPFLTAQRVVFCGFNAQYFPDRLDITPYLTDSLRKQAGLRSNRDTVARARCHLQSLLGCRAPGAVDFIVIRRDRDGQVLRPSPLFFTGRELPETVLLERCETLFQDPKPYPTPQEQPGGSVFRLRPRLECPRDPEGRIRLSPTALDQYLTSPYLFFLTRVRRAEAVDYTLNEPDAPAAGGILHAAFEKLGIRTFPEASQYADVLLDALDAELTSRYGSPPYPMTVRLLREGWRQRLRAAADLLHQECSEGFRPVAVEYPLDGVEFEGAVFTGRIDRIEYDPIRRIVRIIDIKTGSPQDVALAHRKWEGERVVFRKLQLPLYALLLREDANFRRLHPDVSLDVVECGYLNLPQNVSDIRFGFWKDDDFEEILPFARAEVAEIVRQLEQFGEGRLYEDPDHFRRTNARDMHFLFPDGMREGLTHVRWECEAANASEPADPNASEPCPAPYIAPTPRTEPQKYTPEHAALADRVWGCPEAVRRGCACVGPGDCEVFQGFRRYSFISASAGTGKTYRLANRFIQLLAFGVDPASIMAVTFTRKASGEIFDKIVGRLLELASSSRPVCACMDHEKVIAATRALLDPDHDVRISTIDSFFMRLLKAFAPELGVWGDISVRDAGDPRLFRRTFRQWLRSVTDPREMDELRELLKQAAPSGELGVGEALMKLLRELQPCFMNKLRLEPDGSMPQLEHPPWPDAPVGDLLSAAPKREELAAALTDAAANLRDDAAAAAERICSSMKKQAGNLERLAGLIALHPLDLTRLDDDLDKLFKYFADEDDQWFAPDRTGELLYSKRPKLSFDAGISELIRRAFRHLRIGFFIREWKRTGAVFELMRRFDAAYASVRRAGNLTFADLPYLLCRVDPDTRDRVLGTADRAMEMRLDAALHHYLFDEFQDTSDNQWQAFDGLARELFAGKDDAFRSFFCVGDIKQSLYQWRDGNPRLFDYLLTQARQAETEYDPRESLNLSFRSAQSVLDLVNCVFADPLQCESDRFEKARLRMDFRPHFASSPDPGFSALIESGRTLDDRCRTIFALLRRIDPLKKNLSVGILVHKNKTAAECADILRTLAREAHWDLPVSSEGRVKVGESMAFNLFAALLTLAEHPGDKLAREIVSTATFAPPEADPEAMGWPEIARRLGLPAGEPAETLREELFRSGIAGLAEKFLHGFGGEMRPADRKRMECTRQMAENFSGTAEEFVAQVRELGMTAASLGHSIQVMTCHHAKGLGFDLVFLPDVRQDGGGVRNVLPAIQRREDAAAMTDPEWISYTPRTSIAATIPTFAQNSRIEREDEDFEECCTLYVALTRAKRGLYVILPPPPQKESAATMTLDRIVRAQLAHYGSQPADHEWFASIAAESGARLLFSQGRESWHDLIVADEEGETAVPCVCRTLGSFEQTRIVRGSDAGIHTVAPSRRFDAPGGTAVGTMVHGLMEKLIRIDGTFDAAAFARENLPDTPEAASAAGIFVRALEHGSEIRALLTDIPENCEIWNERKFLLKRNGRIIPGAFDRVAVFRENGVPVRAEICDWKSDALASAEEFGIYAGQLRVYRGALAQLLGLPETAIRTFIGALQLKKIVPVE